ncbi:hypothetical protein MY1884_004146, partial [Beauveria asiatica]
MINEVPSQKLKKAFPDIGKMINEVPSRISELGLLTPTLGLGSKKVTSSSVWAAE